MTYYYHSVYFDTVHMMVCAQIDILLLAIYLHMLLFMHPSYSLHSSHPLLPAPNRSLSTGASASRWSLR